jgi:phage-related protein
LKTLTSPISTQAAAAQSGWCELYDYYLPAAIVTPFGTVSVLRLTTLPGGIAFFTPKLAPEPTGTQGNAQAYTFWPLARQVVNGSTKFTNDKLVITTSNVTGDWATMLNEVDWEAVQVIVRKVNTTITTPTADDCAVLFSGSVDTVVITLEQLQFTVSNDLGAFQLFAPRENMHSNCRFRWADDQCTALRYLPANYKAKTCGSSSTTTNVKCAGLTEDTGAKGAYGTDLVAALANGNITTSSSFAAIVNSPVTWKHFPLRGPQFQWFFVFANGDHTLALGQKVVFGGATVPAGLTAGTPYYVINTNADGFSNQAYQVSATVGGARLDPSTVGSGVTVTTDDFSGKQVKAGNTSYWALDPAGSDWGTNIQGYWQIPDAQAGLANFLLAPWITFDFGAATQPTLWRVNGINSGDRGDLPRLLQFFSSTDNFATGKFEMHFEMPPVLGGLWDVLIPNASNSRYWRICVRNRWSATKRIPLLEMVSAYAGSRHYWQDGRITFGAATSTVALRGVSRAVLESYSGELICAPLPVAPANGDTFTIERGCSRTFNACAARSNIENFGGFNTLPFVSITTHP